MHHCEDIDTYDLSKFLQIGTESKLHILIIGESPSMNGWIKSGRAFYDTKGRIVPTGKRLNQLLADFDLRLEECSFTEVCKCFVGNDRKQLVKCADKCWPILIKQLELYDFKLLITLGVKTKEVFENKLNIDLGMGVIDEIKISVKSYKILPIYHPSPINPKSFKMNKEILSRQHNMVKSLINNK